MERKLRIGYRGRALLTLAVLDFVYATGLAVAGTSSSGFASEAIPEWVLIALWAAVGASCLWHAFRVRDALGWSLAIGIKALWGVFAGVGWMLGEIPYGYIAAVVWWAFGMLVWVMSRWPEPVEIQVPELPYDGNR